MQTSSSNILSFDASIAGGIKQQSASSNGNEDSGEFLSMVLEAAASKGENLSEQDIRAIANSVNMSAQKRDKPQQAKESIDIKEILGADTANELFENATFMQLLQILEMLNGGERISKYPNFSSRLAKALSNEANINELKGAKNITELIDIAKKLNLGLEKITITKEQVAQLNAKFPNLAKNNFFTQVLSSQNGIFKAKLKEDTVAITNKEEPVKLNKLLRDIQKESSTANLAENTNKSAPVQKENIAQNIQKESVKNEAVKVAENLSGEPKTSNQAGPSKINLQSLLYPEREQSIETQANADSQNSGEGELNSMVKEIMQNARGQSKNLQMIKQTFDNFNTTLKEQVEAYKSPFMRFNITLNPINLGEVEITMVNRGNNLHINFNSTTQTMNLFLQNQAEFKASLVNMGFTELEMNFSDQNQKKEQGDKTYKSLNLNGNDDSETMEQSLLEIVLPRYI